MLRCRCSKCHKTFMTSAAGMARSITTTTTPSMRSCLWSPTNVTSGPSPDRRGCYAIHGTPASLLCRTGTLKPPRKCKKYCVCVCVRSLTVPCSLDAFTLRKYDPKPGQVKSYDFVVKALKDDLPACLGKVDNVLTNRCVRGGTTPLWHHTPVTPHHHYPCITAPHHMHMHPLTPPCWQRN